jgi:hypothetical protein
LIDIARAASGPLKRAIAAFLHEEEVAHRGNPRHHAYLVYLLKQL